MFANPETNKIFLVIVLTVLIVIGVNALLYVGLRRGDDAGLIELSRKAFKRARNPWQDEDDALQELSNLVAKHKEEVREDLHSREEEEPHHSEKGPDI